MQLGQISFYDQTAHHRDGRLSKMLASGFSKKRNQTDTAHFSGSTSSSPGDGDLELAAEIREQLNSDDRAVQRQGEYKLRRLESDEIKMKLIEEAVISDNKNVQVLGVNAIATLASDNVKVRLIEQALTSDNTNIQDIVRVRLGR